MATAHEHAVKAEQLLTEAELIPSAFDLSSPEADRIAAAQAYADCIAAAQVHVDLAKVRLELERRAAENAATDRLLANAKPSPRSLDPRANRKAAERRFNNKKKPSTAATDEGSR